MQFNSTMSSGGGVSGGGGGGSSSSNNKDFDDSVNTAGSTAASTSANSSGNLNLNATANSPDDNDNDERWCEGDTNRYGEYGVVGAEQSDESYYDERRNAIHIDDDDDDDGDMDVVGKGGGGRIKFSKRKLYGRDVELKQLHTVYNRLLNHNKTKKESSKTSSHSSSSRSGSDSGGSGGHGHGNAQIVFLKGYSGTGKSSLVNEFFKQIQSQSPPQPKEDDQQHHSSSSTATVDDGSGGTTATSAAATDENGNRSRWKLKTKKKQYYTKKPFFITGKFDELQGPNPYSAIADGLNKFFEWLSDHQDDEEYTESIETIRNSLLNPQSDDAAPRQSQSQRHQHPQDQLELQKQKQKQKLQYQEQEPDNDLDILIEIIPGLSRILGSASRKQGGRSTASSASLSSTTITRNNNGDDNNNIYDLPRLRRSLSNQSMKDYSNDYDNDDDDNEVGGISSKRSFLYKRSMSESNLLQRKGSNSFATTQTTNNKAKENSTNNSTKTTTTTTTKAGIKSLHRIKHYFRNLILALCSRDRPLIIFLDDLQWSDAGSLDLMSILLYDRNLKHIMFIGSYRSNEVNPKHALSTFIAEVVKNHSHHHQHHHENDGDDHAATATTNSTSTSTSTEQQGRLQEQDKNTKHVDGDEEIGVVVQMEMSDLSPEHIAEFIADTLDLKQNRRQVHTLSEAVYSKTLGNIFFTMQAIEELVRKNALFYDVMLFKWDWNLSQVELADLLSDDVVAMVKSKIQHLKLPTKDPKDMSDGGENGNGTALLQHALTVASYTRSTFDVDLLRLIMLNTCYYRNQNQDSDESNTICISMLGKDQLMKLLDFAVLEGLLLNVIGTNEYTFAHDRIQEAATSFLVGEDRDRLRLHIAKVLLERSSSDGIGEDWMLFAGVHHLNSLPSFYHSSGANGFSFHEVASLNLRAAKLAIVKSAFAQAVELLRCGKGHMNKSGVNKWADNYELYLDLLNNLLEIEFTVGNHELSKAAVDEVLENARSVQDKVLAQAYYLEVLMKERKYGDTKTKALEFLGEHDIKFPGKVSKADNMRERLRVQFAKRNRRKTDMATLPRMDDYNETVLRMLFQLVIAGAIVDDPNLSMASALVAQRRTWERGINGYGPVMMGSLSVLARRDGNLREAYKLGSVALDIMERASGGSPLCRGLSSVAGCVLLLGNHFTAVLEKLNEGYRVGMAAGDIEWGILCAMQYCHGYFCAGWPTGAVLVPKIILFEEECLRLSQPPSVTITFSIFRQTLLNLQGKGGRNPVTLKGSVVDEESAMAQFEGVTLRQTLRDFGIFRLLLACIFLDDNVQQEMVDRLTEYPSFDYTMPRQHLRDMLVGLAALSLGRKRNDKKYLAIGRAQEQGFQKLVKIGSVVAPPVVLCMRAFDKPNRENFEKAIDICSRSGILHLEAMMCERYGLFLMNETNVSSKDSGRLAKEYLTRAMWVFFDWGAMGKVDQMRKTHRFLHGSRRSESTPSALLSFMSTQFTTDIDSSARTSGSYSYSAF